MSKSPQSFCDATANDKVTTVCEDTQWVWVGWLKGYLDSLVKAALLGKIKDAACIDVGEQLFQRSTAKTFMAYDCGTWTF